MTTNEPVYTENVPEPFPGTPAEARANLATHRFDPLFGRCSECDVRPSYVSAQYPCGATPRRLVRTRYADGTWTERIGTDALDGI